MGKVPVDRERLTVILGEACKSLAISSIDAGGNDDNTLGVRGD